MKSHKNLSVDLDLQTLGDNLSIWPTEKNFEEIGSVNNQEFGQYSGVYDYKNCLIQQTINADHGS